MDLWDYLLGLTDVFKDSASLFVHLMLALRTTRLSRGKLDDSLHLGD